MLSIQTFNRFSFTLVKGRIFVSPANVQTGKHFVLVLVTLAQHVSSLPPLTETYSQITPTIFRFSTRCNWSSHFLRHLSLSYILIPFIKIVILPGCKQCLWAVRSQGELRINPRIVLVCSSDFTWNTCLTVEESCLDPDRSCYPLIQVTGANNTRAPLWRINYSAAVEELSLIHSNTG